MYRKGMHISKTGWSIAIDHARHGQLEAEQLCKNGLHAKMPFTYVLAQIGKIVMFEDCPSDYGSNKTFLLIGDYRPDGTMIGELESYDPFAAWIRFFVVEVSLLWAQNRTR